MELEHGHSGASQWGVGKGRGGGGGRAPDSGWAVVPREGGGHIRGIEWRRDRHPHVPYQKHFETLDHSPPPAFPASFPPLRTATAPPHLPKQDVCQGVGVLLTRHKGERDGVDGFPPRSQHGPRRHRRNHHPPESGRRHRLHQRVSKQVKAERGTVAALARGSGDKHDGHFGGCGQRGEGGSVRALCVEEAGAAGDIAHWRERCGVQLRAGAGEGVGGRRAPLHRRSHSEFGGNGVVGRGEEGWNHVTRTPPSHHRRDGAFPKQDKAEASRRRERQRPPAILEQYDRAGCQRPS
eukprot:scaffold345_cov104-Isochrysis_galbana.AAC.13